MRFILLCIPALVACDPGCDAAKALSSGQVVGEIDGVAWESAGVTWHSEASGVQVNSPLTDGWRLTLVAQTTVDDRSAPTRVDRRRLPVEVLLQSGEGGWALLNDAGAFTWSTHQAEGGWLRLARRRGGDLLGCYDFEAGAAAGEVAAHGAFRAAPR